MNQTEKRLYLIKELLSEQPRYQNLFHVEKTNTSALRLYERLGYKIFRDDGNRMLLQNRVKWE